MSKAIAKIAYNSHDMGEVGKFIRLEYVEPILRQALKDLLQHAIEEMQIGERECMYGGYHASDKPCTDCSFLSGRAGAKKDFIAVLTKLRESV